MSDSKQLDRIERMLLLLSAQQDDLRALAKLVAQTRKPKTIKIRARPKLGKGR